MKSIKYWIALFFSIIAVASNAQTLDASFSCDDFEIAAGETKIVQVSMASKEENIYGFQVRITIPEELSFAPVSGTGTRARYATLNSDRGPSDEGYTITTTRNMGEIKSSVILSKNDDGYPYYGTSGVIFSFAVTASADIKAGAHNIKFSEIEIVKDVSVQINPADFDVSANVLPTGVTLDKTTASIVEGSTETLTAKLLPGEVVAGTEVSWSTSNDKVATVSNGVVTAVAMGEADITVTTSNNKTATCKVTVTENFDKTAANFKTDYSEILGKTTSTVASSDLTAIENALAAYESLSSGAQAKLSSEKSLLDNLKAKAEELKAAEEAEAAATAAANQFKTDNAAILGKTTATVTSSDIDAINAALEAYNQLSDAAKAKVATEKSLLDALKAKAEELKAAEEAADAAATAAANKFKTDNATILAKTTATVTSSDLDAINKALEEYNALSDAAKAKLTNGEKALLDALKAKAEELKAAEEAADAAATAAANKFKTDNANILAKTTATVTSSDLAAINKAIEDYNALSAAAKAKLTNGEKALLDALKAKAEEIKAAEEAADAAATAAANQFKTDNAAILAKTTENVASADLTAINKALEDYNALSEAAKAKLTNGEKALLDALKAKAEELKAAEEAAEAAATAAANKFKTDNAAILAKTTATVTSSDLTAINKALEDYNALSDAAKAKLTNGEKALLDALKAKAEEIKAAEEADAAATAAANKFKTDNAAILAKTTDNVASSDLTAINKALEDYNALSDDAKAKLTNGEKALLDALKAKAEEIKAAEEADAAATAAANKFKTDNAAILAKTTDNVASSDLAAINKALSDYNKLSEAAKAKLTNGEKALLDALKAKAEELKAAEEADAAATAAANKFKTDNAAILGKTTENVKSSDLAAINKALEDYNKLSEAAKAKVATEKSLLDSLKTKAEEIKAAEEAADAAATAEANKFKTDNAAILAKTTATVTDADLAAINKALEDYDKLSDAAKAKLTNEKALLDALKATASADKDTKEAISKFKTDNKDILAKSVDEVTESDLAAINKALEEYGKLTDAAKSALSVEKKLLDDMKAKIEKEQAVAAEVEKFKTDNADILGKSTEDITSADLDAINKALDDYDKLSDEAKSLLTNGEKDLLDSLKEKAEELKAAEEAEQKATEDAEGFKDDNKDILDKDLSEITPEDLDAINKALDDYGKLSDDAKDKLKDEKKDLDDKKEKAEEIASGINSANTAKSKDIYYNLNGQRVNNNAKGLLIKNGKKVMVK